jgi:uncharacterized protein with PQ loop repeat
MYDYLMNAASFIYITCYVPELYANWKNKNANIYNIPEKVVMVLGTSFAFSYSVLNNDTSLMINYAPILGLDIMALLMRVYYVWKNRQEMGGAVELKDEESASASASASSASPTPVPETP